MKSTDLQVIEKHLKNLLREVIICYLAFCIWFYTLGRFSIVGGIGLGILLAAFVFIILVRYRNNTLPKDLPADESNRLHNEILNHAAKKSSKRLIAAYQQCDLNKSFEYIALDNLTGEKYRLIFRKMRNEKLQASDLPGGVQTDKIIPNSHFANTAQTNSQSSAETETGKQGVQSFIGPLPAGQSHLPNTMP